ncbi:ComEA family DNA-binding protein [Brumicola pallidula]|uniref:Competence protein ComEA n=1 Tax=Brumicola pallidula DSM 14239 = ACAM 615 TaxID=1121922 RepID=K6YAW8_9ALTE|nr:helix-hairpin-helix domain-containing protein [Glaciecola pallidula]GAC29884.1 competence protein ComEA [Glaciecola pallidula DSM 14239 = ACAM 615]
MKKFNCLLLCTALLSSCAFMPAQAAADATAKKAMSQAVDNKLDINKASAEQLTALPGVGSKKAGEIVKYRKLNGNFKSVDELVNVKGIGVKMVAKMIDLVKV